MEGIFVVGVEWEYFRVFLDLPLRKTLIIKIPRVTMEI